MIDSKNEFKLVEVKDYSLGSKTSENILIKSENLIALKLLEDQYANEVRCIYIDPPYNNGEDFHHYEDKTCSQTWADSLKQRLEVMWKLLRDDGSIWISIDENEIYNLKAICDSVFGKEQFITTFIWNQRTSRENRRVFSVNHEYILLYAKKPKVFGEKRNRLKLTEEVLKRYKNPDNDPRGPWQSVSMNVQGGHGTKSQFYDLIAPNGKKHTLPSGRCWTYTESKLKEEVKKNNIWFGKNGDGVPRIKKFLKDVSVGLTPHTLWMAEEVGTTDSAKKDLKKLFDLKNIFETPKPEALISRIIEISTDQGDLVLDAYLGSGTTIAVAHKLKRNWIGIESGDQVYSYCVPRIEKVINGQDDFGISDEVNWQGGGGFKFYELKENKNMIPTKDSQMALSLEGEH